MRRALPWGGKAGRCGPRPFNRAEPAASRRASVARRSRVSAGAQRTAHNELRTTAEGRKVGILLVTHDLEEAVEVSYRLVFLGERPARVVLEQELLVPRSQRDRTMVSTLARQLSTKVVVR